MKNLQNSSALIRRFGFASAGVICWQGATHIWESGTPVAYPYSIVLMLAGYLIGFALFFLAALSEHPKWSVWLILGALLAPILCYAEVHRLAILQNGMLTTDLQLYMDYGARLLQQGENPYGKNLLEAYRLHRAPFNFSTLLTDGDLTGRMAYPALSVLIFLPFQWLGISTHWVYLFFLILALVLIFIWTPHTFRPLVLLPFFLDKRFFLYTIGGVSDCVWALLLVLVVQTWHRPRQRAIWYGLACAFKHQPWGLLPFLLMRLWLESSDPPRVRWRKLALFAGLSAGAFLAVNLPFIIWDPLAWLRGIFEPILTPMITFGQGLSLITMLGIVVIPKAIYSLFLVAMLALSLALYWRHFSRLRPIIWILPGLILWFSNRSLTSYWYFFLLPFIFDLFVSARQEQPREGKPHSWRVSLAAAVSVMAAILGITLLLGLQTPRLAITTVPPMHSVGNHIDRITVKVQNNSSQQLKPLFALQWGVLQPFYWHIEEGPQTLAPQRSGLYTISTDVPFARFDIRQGARLSVSHAGSFDLRATIRIEPDPSYVYPDVIPNGHYRYWEGDQSHPTYWGIVQQPGEVGSVRLIQPEGPAAPETALHFRLEPAPDAELSFVLLDTYISLPHRPVELWLKVPRGANRLPGLEIVYGLNLTVEHQHIWILFGDRAAKGKVSANTHYWITPAPRERWSKQVVDLRQVLAELGIKLHPQRMRLPRFHHLDFPLIPTNFQLLVAAKRGSSPVDAYFGPVTSQAIAPDPARLLDYAQETPEALELWLGEYNFAMRNYQAAIQHFTAATQASPTSSVAWLRLGEARFWHKDLARAIEAYTVAIKLDPRDPLPYKGLGWCHSNLKRYDQAILAWNKALSLLEQRARPEERSHLADTHKGLGLTFLKKGWCKEARLHLSKMKAINANQYFPSDALKLCVLNKLRYDTP